jgi:tRNA threonylcarbamoyladenosine biosynthesis protein TsaE
VAPPPCLTICTTSAEDTQLLGEELGRALRPGDLVLLQGPIGAGKTTLTQGIARGLGLDAYVTSPSFTLANVYQPTGAGRVPLYHLDLWRIKSPAEALGIGLDEYLDASGPCVIEWPDVAATVLPGDYLRIRIEPAGDARTFEVCPFGERPAALVEALRAGPRGHPAGDGRAAGH